MEVGGGGGRGHLPRAALRGGGAKMQKIKGVKRGKELCPMIKGEFSTCPVNCSRSYHHVLCNGICLSMNMKSNTKFSTRHCKFSPGNHHVTVMYIVSG